MIAGLLIVTIVTSIRMRGPVDRWYQTRAEQCENLANDRLKSEDYEAAAHEYEAASLCYRRLIQTSTDNERVDAIKFGQALMIDGEGKALLKQAERLTGDSQKSKAEEAMRLRGRALNQMRQLAPEDKSKGFARAHYWIATTLLTQFSPTPSNIASAELHIAAFLKQEPSNTAAKALLGQIYQMTGRFKESRPFLEETVHDFPSALVQLALVYQALGEKKEAKQTAHKAKDHFLPVLKKDSKNNDVRILLAQTMAILEDFDGAIEILRGGELDKLPSLKHMMAGVYASWAASLPSSSTSGTDGSNLSAGSSRRVELIETGLSFEPGNRGLIAMLAELLLADGDPVEKNAARILLVSSAASGKGSADAMEILGRDALRRNQLDQAKSYWEQAYNQDPTVKDRPTLLLALAEIYRATGDSNKSEKYATKSVELFGSLLGSNPDNTKARVWLSEAHTSLGDFPLAINVLKEGQLRKDLPEFRRRIANTYAAWADHLSTLDPKERGKPSDGYGSRRIEMCDLGLRQDPVNPSIIERLDRLIIAPEVSVAEKTAARTILSNLAARRDVVAGVYNTLAKDAFINEKFEEARLNWEHAYELVTWDDPSKLGPIQAILINNLAWLVATTQPVDLARAMKLVNRALEIDPNNPSFRGTRGEILYKLARFKDARDDLKAAIDAKQATPRIREIFQEIDKKLAPAAKPDSQPVGGKPGF